ncbi:mechanosensitive ion channel protein [Aliidiomarina minuta]|uniref:Small-conductance mechanosensitive channel n=1 Tax=Aliidiomarina minuta TaxID=880057 RepID=A0A432W8P9_9GAMM|nr:mechanosensitive ion channel domain-containing protein [Aliidiomarina minuta]RUO26425.1 mechanosensitive ion channel protein [Aliidiomarina minuta]
MNDVILWFQENQAGIFYYVGRLLIALMIIVGGFVISKAIGRTMIRRLDKSQIDNAVVSFLVGILRTIIVVAALLMALSHVGIQTTSFIAILGAAGLAVGLALQGSLSNFASGVLIMIYRPFYSGDYVEAGNIAGTVLSIELFNTVLKTPDNKVVTVPNSQITNSPITNYSRQPTRRVDMVIGVSYAADLKKTKEVLMQVINEDERVLPDPEPRVAVTELGDSSVNLIVRPWVDSADYWPVYWDMMEKIKIRLDENGIGIPFPQMDVHLHQAGSDEGPIRIQSVLSDKNAAKNTATDNEQH